MADFNEIIGNDQIKEHMKRAISSGKVSHAYILDGALGSGKILFAKAFAQMLQCENELPGGACHNCHSCRQAETDVHPDIVYVTHEKPATISVDDIRTQINVDIATKPYQGKYKIYIVDEAEKMNVQAQNALLKTIEEPPEYAIIMLLTTNAFGFLQTILSRCVRLELKPVAQETIVDYLVRKYKIVDYRAREAAAFSMGAVGRAINLATSESFNELRECAIETLKKVHELDMPNLMAIVKKTVDFKNNIKDFLDIMLMWYRDVLMYKTIVDSTNLIFQDQIYDIKRRADRSSYNDIKNSLENIELAVKRLDSNVNYEMTIELLLLNLKES